MIREEYRHNASRLGIAFAVYLLCLWFSVNALNIDGPETAASVGLFIPLIVLAAFIFELLDSGTGMGFGTALAPLFFVMGYDPLTIVPTLLVSQAFAGLLAGWMHNRLGNIDFSPRSSNSVWRALLLITVTGGVTITITVITIYETLGAPDRLIKTYVAILVVLMGGFVFLRNRYNKQILYKNSRLLGFALLAAFNKGIGGGGYGPVLTLGALLSGYKEKETVALVVAGEGLVSLIGAIVFFSLMNKGLAIDYSLLPSILTGGFLAAFLAPYFVKICPPSLLQLIIPSYAVVIGLFILADLYLF